MPLPNCRLFCPSNVNDFPLFFDPVEVYQGAEWATILAHSCAHV
jgi:hypothetical protein